MSIPGAGNGLATANRIYENRPAKAKDLKAQGKKIIGYLCCYTPTELITAAGLVPYRLSGNMRQAPLRADTYLETITCPFVRSAFDMALQGDYDFLDGLVVPHGCDNIVKVYDIWRYWMKPAYDHFINIPHLITPAALGFFEAELGRFQRSLEKFVGTAISEAGLQQVIRQHNENRVLVRELYTQRKPDPPRLSAVESTKVVLAVLTLPVEEGTALLREVLQEVKKRQDGPPRHPARLLVHGAELDDAGFMELVEELGANVVVDDLCVGTRSFWHNVEVNGSPLKALARRYLEKVYCPRTLRPCPSTRAADLDARFGHLRQFAQDFAVNGAIFYIIRFCDTFEFDAPEVKAYLEEAGVPVLQIEGDYSMVAIARLRTRVQAFLEMIA